MVCSIQFHVQRFNINPPMILSDVIYEAAGRIYAQMAEFDRLTNQTKYKDMLKRYFALAESAKPSFLDLSSVCSHYTF